MKITVYHSISVGCVGGVEVSAHCDYLPSVFIDGEPVGNQIPNNGSDSILHTTCRKTAVCTDIKAVDFLSKCITSVYRNDSRQSQMRA